MHRIYVKYRREQLGVAERSDADERLRSAVDVGFQSVFTETKRILLGNIFSLLWNRNGAQNVHQRWRRAVDAGFQNIFTENWKSFTLKTSSVFSDRQMVHLIYTGYGRELSAVTGRSEAYDRLWRIVDAWLQTSSTENMKKIATKEAIRHLIYEYTCSLIHWRANVLSQKDVWIIRWAVLVDK